MKSTSRVSPLSNRLVSRFALWRLSATASSSVRSPPALPKRGLWHNPHPAASIVWKPAREPDWILSTPNGADDSYPGGLGWGSRCGRRGGLLQRSGGCRVGQPVAAAAGGCADGGDGHRPGADQGGRRG